MDKYTKNGIRVLPEHKPKKSKNKKVIVSESEKRKEREQLRLFEEQILSFNKKVHELKFNEDRIAVYWDIENISQKYILDNELEYLKKASKRIIVHAIDMEFEESIKKNWKIKKVNQGKNAADYMLLKEIENDINHFNHFVIISNDRIFLHAVNHLLKHKRNVYLLKSHIIKNHFNDELFPNNHELFMLDILEKKKIKDGIIKLIMKKINFFLTKKTLIRKIKKKIKIFKTIIKQKTQK